MLKLPAFKQYNDASVFSDDQDLARFYVIPTSPSVRVNDKGDPVFLLIKYAFSDQEREAHPEVGAGGGYLVFDAELRVPDKRREEITADLQKWVNDEWERRKNNPPPTSRTFVQDANVSDALSRPNTAASHQHFRESITMALSGAVVIPRDAAPPPVVLGEPLWKSGKVTLRAPSSPSLVIAKNNETRASMLGNNVASFSLDLTAEGATFMQRTLVETDGRGATDLTPLSVEYELTMLARLPPAHAYVKVHTQSLYHTMHELVHDFDGHGCGTDEYTTIESKLTMAMSAGMVEVRIDAGGVTDADMIRQLTQQAQASVTELLKDRFAVKVPKEDKDQGDDVASSTDDVYRLKRETEMQMFDFEQTTEIDPTTEWTIAPQATMQTFLEGRSKDVMKKFVREINLEDDFFKTLDLSVRAYASWEDGVDFVSVELLYEGRDASGQNQTKTQTLTFSASKHEPEKWNPALLSGSRKYRYRTSVGFKGRGQSEPSAWQETSSRALNISVETPGKIDVEVLPAGVDFANVFNLAVVSLRYEDRARNVPLEGFNVVLNADRNTGAWTRMIYAPWDKPYQYKVDFYLKTGAVLSTDWTAETSRKLPIVPPFVDVLDVTLLPAVDWTEVQVLGVAAKYADGPHNYFTDAQLLLKSDAEFKQWKVVLRDPSVRDWQYQVTTIYKTGGDARQTEWKTLTGDKILAVTTETAPRLKVNVTGIPVDWSQTPLVKVALRYDDAAGNVHTTNSITLKKETQVDTWSVRIADLSRRKYSYAITYYPTTGPAVTRPEQTTDDPMLVVPRYDIPRVGAQFRPDLVNFDKTPLVEVLVRYNDAQRGVRGSETLIFTSKTPQEWFMPVDDAAPRLFTYEVTWHLPDDTTISAPPVTTDRDRIPVPAYRPAPPNP
ncbi:MAG: hypothetical protein U0326_21360 [Polyangiales bacterium]